MEPFFCVENFDHHHEAPFHPPDNRRWREPPHRSSRKVVDEGYEWSRAHLWNTIDDFATDAANSHYDVYDNQHYGCSRSRIFGSRLRNERLSYPLSRLDSGPSLNGGIHDNERIDLVGDFEAYVNQSQNDETTLYPAAHTSDHFLSFSRADLPVRGPGYTEPGEEGFFLPEDDQKAGYHHSWCTVFPVSDKHSSTTIDPSVDANFSRQFVRHLPNRAKASDLTSPDTGSPTFIQATTTDGSFIHNNPLYFDSTSSTPNFRDSQQGDYFKQQWRLLSIAVATLRRQRRRIRHSLRVLHRSQKALELERREFRNVQKNNIQDPERNQSWYSTGRKCGMDDGDDAWHRDTDCYWESRRKMTEQPREKDILYEASRSDDEPTGSSRHCYRHYSNHHYPGGPHGHIIPPPLTPDAVSQAKDNFMKYESAWTYLSDQSQTNTLRIPYPTVTMQAGPLLESFPSYVRLPRLPDFHPPAHVRIQFHALEFYLHPLGLQTSLTFRPLMQSFDDPEKVPDAVVGVDGIERLNSNSLIELKCGMINEVRKWHEDSLRRKGFGTVLDSCSAITQDFDSKSKQDHHARRSEFVIGDVHDFEEKLTERDIVQGVWAAVQLLKDLVIAEIKRRNMK
ncbi:hypothetical protein MMC27_006301 [Xylographa pallens]|nr:hypothetical protein [Xylographa pallens]